MIERYVLIGLQPEHTDEAADLAAQIESMARALPMVAFAAAAPALDPGPTGPHIVVRLRFADAADLAAYLPHPAHRALVDGTLKPRAASLTAVNIEAAPGG